MPFADLDKLRLNFGGKVFLMIENMTRQYHSQIKGFIQAGGQSSRMGTDKAWLEIEGVPMIERVITAARPVVESLAIIINRDNPQMQRYQKLAGKLNARLIDDLHHHLGPLGGIHTALSNCQKDVSGLILACDLPFLTTEFLFLLCQIHQIADPQSAIRNPQSITLPVDGEGRLQPLAAVYSNTCLSVVEQMLADNVLRVDQLFLRVKPRSVLFKEYAHLLNAERIFQNINSMEDYQRERVNTKRYRER